MIYYLQNKTLMEITNDIKNNLPYQNMADPRNFAIIYIHANGITEKILRTPNLEYHYMAIKALSKISKPLSFLVNKEDITDPIHYDLDVKLAKEGTLAIYYSPPSFEMEENYGLIYIPEDPTDFQKQFLRNNIPFFEVYPNLYVARYNSLIEGVEQINEQSKEKGIIYLKEISSEPSFKKNK